ncbi:nitroreductase family deazaflavin-dependent oxidoreductase [Agrococcus jejuensis]|nr:nitroreductase family deazaflavin-dependent oxidoreductase [Agrococcus jejuensis]
MGLLTPLAVRIGALPWMPRLLPAIVRVDGALLRMTRGRRGVLDVAGLPNLTLRVAGRRSGVVRATPLLAVPHDGGFLIAGSYFGAEAMPAWVANLRAVEAAGAHAEVVWRGATLVVAPRELHEAERAAAWQRLLGVWPNFAVYERRTSRRIPVIHLAVEG